MFFIDTFCLFLLLEIFSLYIRVFICHFITRFLFSASSFYSWNLVSFFFSSFLFIDLALQNISFISLHYSSYYRNFSLSFIIVIPFFLSYLFVHLPFIIEIPSSIDPLPSFFRNASLILLYTSFLHHNPSLKHLPLIFVTFNLILFSRSLHCFYQEYITNTIFKISDFWYLPKKNLHFF